MAVFCKKCGEMLDASAPLDDPCPRCGGSEFAPGPGPDLAPALPREANTAEQLATILAATRAEYQTQLEEAQRDEEIVRAKTAELRAILIRYEHTSQASNVDQGIKNLNFKRIVKQRFTARATQLSLAYMETREEPLVEAAVRQIDTKLFVRKELTVGARVLTLQEDKSVGGDAWAPIERANVRWGVTGQIINQSHVDGVAFQVQHGDCSAWYAPTELHVEEEEVPF